MGADTTLYVWGSYLMGLAVMVTELVLLRLRELAVGNDFETDADVSEAKV